MTAASREKQIYKVTWVGFAINALLSIAKLLAGILGRSTAMLADAVHSISDFATDLVVLVFIRISAKPQDEGHDYGHGKYETLATIIIGLALLIVGIGIFTNSLDLIRLVLNGGIIPKPRFIALIAAIASIATKEGLFWYTIAVGNKINSTVVKANAWHHRSDAFSSIGTLIGIGGAYFLGEQWRILDPIAAIVVSLLIAKVAYDLIIPSLNDLLERSLSQEQEDEIISIIMQDYFFSDPHKLKTRRIGSNIAIEIHLRVHGNTTVEASHHAVTQIETRLKKQYGVDTQVIVHVEPLKET